MTDTLNPLALNELLDRPQPERDTDNMRSALARLINALEPAIHYTGVEIRLGKVDVAEIRNAIAQGRRALGR